MSKPFTPHDYQYDIMQFIWDNPRCGVWALMGTGKTVSTLSALVDLDLAEPVFPVLVLAPKRVALSTWPDEVKKWGHLEHLRVQPINGTPKQRQKALDTPADIYTMAYDNLVWLADTLGDRWPFEVVVADECFVAGTMVTTPEGLKRIDDIKIGDIVETHVGPRPVSHIHKRFTDAFNLVSLKLSNGDQINVTAEHPFFTDLGWLPARACGGRRLYGRACLSDLSNALSEKSHEGARTGAETTSSVLRSRMQNQRHLQEPTGAARSSCAEDARAERGAYDILELWEAMVRCPSGEDVGGAEGPDFSAVSRGERDGHVTDRGFAGAFDARRLYVELCHTVGGLWAGLSVELQAGFRRSGTDGVLGSGWPLTPYTPRTGAGQAEERAITVLGVDCLSDRQRENMVAVFNLEVEGAPTYFAAGFLVHNCTRLKSFRLRQGGKAAAALGRYAFTKVRRFVGLTGTPSANGLKDLWGQMWFVDKGERLGRTFSAFEQRWFRVGYDGFSLQPMAHAQGEIQGLLADVCLTVAGLPVDEPIRNTLCVDLPPAARRLYDDMEAEMFAEIGEDGVEAANAAVRTQKCLQLSNGAIYTDDEGHWEAVHDAKLAALESIVEEANGAPVLVAYNFQHDLDRLRRHFPKARVLDADPDTIREWNAGRIPVLLAHPESAGHGLNLADGGNILAFFGLDWSLENHMQIIERVGPMRQKQAGYDRPVFVHYIIARGTVDEMVMERLETKKTVQDILLAAMERKKHGTHA